PKKYSELSATESIQADCDVKATNIILQGLPPEVYALVSNHKVAKELWERTQLLMQGTSLTKQERECKLYDEFDKFAYKKEESLLRDLHTKNVDQLHAYLGQHEFHANESLQYGSPYQSSQCRSHAQSSTPLSITYPSNDFQSSVHHNVYNPSSSIPQVEYALSVHQQSDFSQPDSSLIGRQNSLAAGTSRPYTSGPSGNNSRKQRTVVCYNCKGEGHMSKQCIKPKRKMDDAWFKDKYVITNNAAYQADDLDAYDSDCNKINSAKIALMANLSHYGFDNLAEVHNQDNVTNNVINQAVQAMPIFEQSNIMNQSETEITRDSNIILYSQYVSESQYAAVQNSNFPTQQDALILIVIEQLKTQVVNCTKINQDNKSVNETLTAELERHKDHVRILKEGNNTELSAEQVYCSQNFVNSDEPNLSTRPTKVEVPKELLKVSMVNLSLKKLKYYLASFDVVVKERTTATAITEGTWGFEYTKACFKDEIIPFAVEQHRVDSNIFQDKMKKVLKENERLLEQAIRKDIVNIVVTANVNNSYEPVNECERCVTLETELQKDFIKKECYDKLFKQYTTLEKHCISLEVDTQLEQEIFQRNNSFS
nr:hypothetical protein [Tanacetum cinerariifolium]